MKKILWKIWYRRCRNCLAMT